MKISNRHGFITFEETSLAEVSRFMMLYEGLEIVPFKDKYTLKPLLNFPEYFIKGDVFEGITLTQTISGEPSEMLRVNGIVYDFSGGLFKKLSSITTKINIIQAANYYVSDGLILPGSLTEDGSRVTDYSAWFLFSESRFKYSSIEVL